MRDRSGSIEGTPDPAPAVPGGAEAGDLPALIGRSVDLHHRRFCALRRRIHASPEPSGAERQTTALVAETLGELGWAAEVGEGEIGVTADLPLAGSAGSMIALRCELDALPLQDEKQLAYASTRPGLCHACGHDVHTAINLAVAAALSDLRAPLRGRRFRHGLRLIFQPAEETATGAREMIRQGALDRVAAILALHVDPELEVGRIGLRAGPLTSAFKSFRITVRGRGGHSARPHEALDPIPAAVAVVAQLYQLGPRSMDSRYPLALTVSSLHAGSSFNVIPDGAVVLGTLRAARAQDLEAVQKRMEHVARGAMEATGCRVELEFVHACPATNNDPGIVELFAGVAASLLGPGAVDHMEVPSLGGEDFAFYQERVPGAMFRLGAAPVEIRDRQPLHSSRFDVNEEALAVGAKIMARSGLRMAETFGGEPRP